MAPEKKRLKFLMRNATLFCFGLLTAAAWAQDFPAARGLVNDFAKVISPNASAQIEAICQELRDKTGAEVAVATFTTIGDEEPAEYVNGLFRHWGLGKKGKDNGVLFFLLVGERKKVRIEVGYGLEGVLPDITAGRILDYYVIPEFKKQDYGAGLLAGIKSIAGVIAADAGVQITGAVRPNWRRGGRSQKAIPPLAWIIIIIVVFALARSGWWWPILFSGGFGSGHGRYRDWGGGGGFGGGFGGGGFGGFGGGSSGGGGAESSW